MNTINFNMESNGFEYKNEMLRFVFSVRLLGIVLEISMISGDFEVWTILGFLLRFCCCNG